MAYATNLRNKPQGKSNYLDSDKVQANKNKPITLSKVQEAYVKYKSLFATVTNGQGTIRDLQHFTNLLELGAIFSLKFNIHKSYHIQYKSAYESLIAQIAVCKVQKKVSWDYISYTNIDSAISLYFKQLYLATWWQLDEAVAIKNTNFRARERKLYCKGDFDHEYISPPNQG